MDARLEATRRRLEPKTHECFLRGCKRSPGFYGGLLEVARTYGAQSLVPDIRDDQAGDASQKPLQSIDLIKNGGTVITDIQPGRFDEHSRKLAQPLLADLFGDPAGAVKTAREDKERVIYLEPNVVGCSQNMANESCRGTFVRLNHILAERSVRPIASITQRGGEPVTDCEPYFFRKGGDTVIALQRDGTTPRPSDTSDRSRGSIAPETIFLTLRRPADVFDLRAKHALGRTDRLELRIDPYEPTLLLTSPIAGPNQP